jgi:hypothetical protein
MRVLVDGARGYIGAVLVPICKRVATKSSASISAGTTASDVVRHIDGLVGSRVRSPATKEGGAVIAPPARIGGIQRRMLDRDHHRIAIDPPPVGQRLWGHVGVHRRREVARLGVVADHLVAIDLREASEVQLHMLLQKEAARQPLVSRLALDRFLV